MGTNLRLPLNNLKKCLHIIKTKCHVSYKCIICNLMHPCHYNCLYFDMREYNTGFSHSQRQKGWASLPNIFPEPPNFLLLPESPKITLTQSNLDNRGLSLEKIMIFISILAKNHDLSLSISMALFLLTILYNYRQIIGQLWGISLRLHFSAED